MPIIKHNRRQRGFTLIEIMISVFILAVGLLGIASMQAQSLQFNFSAYQRSQATFLAYDIVDRIRVNKPQALLGSYNFALGAGPVSATNCQAAGAGCSTGDMANFDLTQWVCGLGNWNTSGTCQGMGIEGPLAEGDGSVVINIVNGRAQVTVTVTWLDNRTLDAADPNRTETFTVSSVL